MKTHKHTINTLFFTGMLALVVSASTVAEASEAPAKKVPIGKMVVYPPEAIGVPKELTDAITVALVTELEAQHIMVYDYRPKFQEMAEEAAADTPFKLTDPVKKTIAAQLKADNYLDGRIFRLGNELRLSVSLRSASGALVLGRTMVMADENDLPIAVSRLVASILTNTSVDETLTLDNATKAETKSKPNRIDLEVYTGLMFGMAVGIGDINSFPLVAFDARFELKKVMFQFDLGIGINGEATHGDVAIAMNYYLLNTAISPYLGIGGGIYIGDKWAKEGDDSSGSAKFFGGQFFPQIGIEFLRSASIRVHADVRYAMNVSDNRFGHGPVALVGIGF